MCGRPRGSIHNSLDHLYRVEPLGPSVAGADGAGWGGRVDVGAVCSVQHTLKHLALPTPPPLRQGACLCCAGRRPGGLRRVVNGLGAFAPTQKYLRADAHSHAPTKAKAKANAHAQPYSPLIHPHHNTHPPIIHFTQRSHPHPAKYGGLGRLRCQHAQD